MDICWKDMHKNVHWSTFLIVKTGNNPNMSINSRIITVLYSYDGLTIKTTNIQTWMSLTNIMLSESQTQKEYITYDSIYKKFKDRCN